MVQATESISRAVSETMPGVWHPQDDSQVTGRFASGAEANVGRTERNVSIAAGVALGVLALTKPLSMRGLLLAGLGGMLVYRGVSGHCALYRMLGISTGNAPNAPSAAPQTYNNRSIHVKQTISIMKSPEELYQFWRNFENLPRFMNHLQSVTILNDNKSHWVAKAPLGSSVEWDAEIINDEPGRLIAWRSVGNPDVDNSGSVRFVSGNERGTEVHVTIDYIPPAGRLGALIARLFGESPETQIREDLQRFKQLMETGEVVSNAESMPRGSCT
jgi:uncharacterized membrane protein